MSQIETLKVFHSMGLIQNIVLKKDLTLHIIQEAKFEPNNLKFQVEYMVSRYKDLYKIDATGKNVQVYANITSHRKIPKSNFRIPSHIGLGNDPFNSPSNGVQVGDFFWLFGGYYHCDRIPEMPEDVNNLLIIWIVLKYLNFESL